MVACAATLEQGLAAATAQALDLAVLDINLNEVQSYPIACCDATECEMLDHDGRQILQLGPFVTTLFAP